MKFSTGKTAFISFPLKTNSIAFCNKLCFTHIACNHCVRDLRVHIDSKLHFHNHVEHNVAQTFKIPGLTRYVRPASLPPNTLLFCILPLCDLN